MVNIQFPENAKKQNHVIMEKQSAVCGSDQSSRS